MDDNDNRISGLENSPQAINQSVMTTARLSGLDGGSRVVMFIGR